MTVSCSNKSPGFRSFLLLAVLLPISAISPAMAQVPDVSYAGQSLPDEMPAPLPAPSIQRSAGDTLPFSKPKTAAVPIEQDARRFGRMGPIQAAQPGGLMDIAPVRIEPALQEGQAGSAFGAPTAVKAQSARQLAMPQSAPLEAGPIETGEPDPLLDALDRRPEMPRSTAMTTADIVAIEAADLGVDLFSPIGVLTPENGGFPGNIWRGVGPRTAREALNGVPRTMSSPVLVDAMRRVAMSVSLANAGLRRAGYDQDSALYDVQRFLIARAQLLIDFGDARGAAQLMARVPAQNADDALLLMKADAALNVLDWAGACASANVGLTTYESPYWTDVALACRAVEGNRPAIELMLDVMPRNQRPMGTFKTLLDAVLSRHVEQDNAIAQSQGQPIITQWPIGLEDSPLQRALALTLGLAPSTEDVERWPTARQGQLAQLGSTAADVRLPAMVALAQRGRVSGQDLLQAVLYVPQQGAGRAPVAYGAMNQRNDRQITDFYGAATLEELRLALGRDRGPVRARQLLIAVRRAEQSGQGVAWALPVGAALKAVAPSQDLWADAGSIAAYISYAGYGADAAEWYGQIRAAAALSDPAAAQSLLSVWPYALIGGAPGQVPFSPQLLDLWVNSQSGLDPQVRARQVSYFYTILEALGYPVAAEAWTRLGADGSYLPGASASSFDAEGYRLAAQRGHLGLVLAKTAAALGPDGATRPNPQTLKTVLRTLVQLRQRDLALRLAAEVLFLQGVGLATNG